MFRRRWSGLPADPIYPSDLTELGFVRHHTYHSARANQKSHRYFVNEQDEIRLIDDPDYYFKYFITKNERWNERQRFAFNSACRDLILARLQSLGLQQILLPLGTPSPSHPHVPILASTNLLNRPDHNPSQDEPTSRRRPSRVVVIFPEGTSELGVITHRVVSNAGGVTKGSMIGLVQALQQQPSSPSDPTPPGVIIANPGELWWWPEGQRGLTPFGRHGVPMASAVHYGRFHDKDKNEIPGNEGVPEHVRYVLSEAVPELLLLRKDDEKDGDKVRTKIDVIAVGMTADCVEKYLGSDEGWEKLGGRLNSLAVVGGFQDVDELKCEGFKRFLEERARAYILHHAPLDTPVAGPKGNPKLFTFTSFGCPVFSAGDALVTEMALVEAQPAILKWIQQVALEGDAYKNPDVVVVEDDEEEEEVEDVDGASVNVHPELSEQQSASS
ncbi:hypothetical protein B0T17DRAFT_144160 [Bombardia bombarda]|uniref:Arb2 domain-containing protein n=1 Tax=Bombardia bombarda TaxID=252184 RepID=A0AA40C874_9PEZI|nr:hypothetical protein B0T17DRAFT_144160 [Bombardia bombarda]